MTGFRRSSCPVVCVNLLTDQREECAVRRKVMRIHKVLWKLAFLVCLAYLPARAQDFQVLPEADVYLKLNSAFRAYLQAKGDRDGGDPIQFSIGPSIELYLKPLVRLKRVTSFDLDDSKSRALVLEAGYRSLTSPNAPSENRMITALTTNFPLKGGFHISDRNRADLDWKSGVFTWRYRNRLAIERTFAVHSYHLIPYVSAEAYYESQYSKVSSTYLDAGSLFPVGKHFEFNAYYEHQNNTGKSPNKQVNALGLALYVYLSAK
jgi:hypothetical protein